MAAAAAAAATAAAAGEILPADADRWRSKRAAAAASGRPRDDDDGGSGSGGSSLRFAGAAAGPGRPQDSVSRAGPAPPAAAAAAASATRAPAPAVAAAAAAATTPAAAAAAAAAAAVATGSGSSGQGEGAGDGTPALKRARSCGGDEAPAPAGWPCVLAGCTCADFVQTLTIGAGPCRTCRHDRTAHDFLTLAAVEAVRARAAEEGVRCLVPGCGCELPPGKLATSFQLCLQCRHSGFEHRLPTADDQRRARENEAASLATCLVERCECNGFRVAPAHATASIRKPDMCAVCRHTAPLHRAPTEVDNCVRDMLAAAYATSCKEPVLRKSVNVDGSFQFRHRAVVIESSKLDASSLEAESTTCGCSGFSPNAFQRACAAVQGLALADARQRLPQLSCQTCGHGMHSHRDLTADEAAQRARHRRIFPMLIDGETLRSAQELACAVPYAARRQPALEGGGPQDLLFASINSVSIGIFRRPRDAAVADKPFSLQPACSRAEEAAPAAAAAGCAGQNPQQQLGASSVEMLRKVPVAGVPFHELGVRDCRLLAVSGHGLLAVAADDASIRTTHLATKQHRQLRYPLSGGQPRCLVWQEAGPLEPGDVLLLAMALDRQVVLWRVAVAAAEASPSGAQEPSLVLDLGRARVSSVCVSGDGGKVGVGTEDGEVLVFHIKPAVGGLQVQRKRAGSISYGAVLASVFSPDGECLFVGGGNDLVSCFSLRLETPRKKRLNTITQFFASQEAPALQCVELSFHRSFVSAVAVHPCSGLLASGGWDGMVCVWDVSPPGLPEPKQALQLAFSTGLRVVERIHLLESSLIVLGRAGTEWVVVEYSLPALQPVEDGSGEAAAR